MGGWEDGRLDIDASCFSLYRASGKRYLSSIDIAKR